MVSDRSSTNPSLKAASGGRLLRQKLSCSPRTHLYRTPGLCLTMPSLPPEKVHATPCCSNTPRAMLSRARRRRVADRIGTRCIELRQHETTAALTGLVRLQAANTRRQTRLAAPSSDRAQLRVQRESIHQRQAAATDQVPELKSEDETQAPSCSPNTSLFKRSESILQPPESTTDRGTGASLGKEKRAPEGTVSSGSASSGPTLSKAERPPETQEGEVDVQLTKQRAERRQELREATAAAAAAQAAHFGRG